MLSNRPYRAWTLISNAPRPTEHRSNQMSPFVNRDSSATSRISLQDSNVMLGWAQVGSGSASKVLTQPATASSASMIYRMTALNKLCSVDLLHSACPWSAFRIPSIPIHFLLVCSTIASSYKHLCCTPPKVLLRYTSSSVSTCFPFSSRCSRTPRNIYLGQE